MASHRPQRAYRLACPNFGADEILALRSLFALLRQHLKQSWELAEAGDADLLIVNLDAPPPASLPASAPVVGCALKPRLHPRGTLHRPLRAAELLAVLTERAGGDPGGAGPVAGAATDRRHRLLGWPRDFERWPAGRIRVLAAMSRRGVAVADIAARTGQPADDVADCLRTLGALGLVETIDVPALGDPAPKSTGRWSGLAARVGLLLGFST